jgi:hypothetical protein
MDIDTLYETFSDTKDENGKEKKNPLRIEFKEQFENIQQLKKTIEIFERMNGWDTEIEQLKKLKNTAVW